MLTSYFDYDYLDRFGSSEDIEIKTSIKQTSSNINKEFFPYYILTNTNGSSNKYYLIYGYKKSDYYRIGVHNGRNERRPSIGITDLREGRLNINSSLTLTEFSDYEGMISSVEYHVNQKIKKGYTVYDKNSYYY